jgi:hypothetical protein
MQVFFVQRILELRHTRGSLVRQDIGTRFFTTWSDLVRGNSDAPHTVHVRTAYAKALTGDREKTAPQEGPEQTLEELLSGMPTAYHDFLKDRSFVRYFDLLSDEDLGELMRLPYPGEAAIITGVRDEGPSADLIREAIAREVGKQPSELTRDDYQNLMALILTGEAVSDIEPLKGLTNLVQLFLDGTQISDVEPLKGLTKLKVLSLNETQVVDIEALEGLTSLQTLSLMGTQVSDIEPVKGLTNLQMHMLDHTQVSDVEPLMGLTKLEALSLTGTRVTNIEPLKGLTNLRQLWLDRTQVTDAAVAELQKALPGLQVER